MASRAKAKWDHGGKSTEKRGYGWRHQLMRAELLRSVILCEECTRQGRTRAGHVADHIRPLAKGGTNDRSNYQLLCGECAQEKDCRDRGQTYKPKRRIGLDGWPA